MDYAAWVAVCRILGYDHLLQGSPAIERMIETINRKAGKPKAKVRPMPIPMLNVLIADRETEYRSRGIPTDLKERADKWAIRKREELANG